MADSLMNIEQKNTEEICRKEIEVKMKYMEEVYSLKEEKDKVEASDKTTTRTKISSKQITKPQTVPNQSYNPIAGDIQRDAISRLCWTYQQTVQNYNS